MAKSTAPTVPDLFPGPDRVLIALQAARDTETLLTALEKTSGDIDRLGPLCRVVLPRLRALACISMSALDDDMEPTARLKERYEGWGTSIGTVEGRA